MAEVSYEDALRLAADADLRAAKARAVGWAYRPSAELVKAEADGQRWRDYARIMRPASEIRRPMMAERSQPAEPGWSRFEVPPEEDTTDRLLGTAESLMAAGISDGAGFGGDEDVAGRIVAEIRRRAGWPEPEEDDDG